MILVKTPGRANAQHTYSSCICTCCGSELYMDNCTDLEVVSSDPYGKLVVGLQCPFCSTNIFYNWNDLPDVSEKDYMKLLANLTFKEVK